MKSVIKEFLKIVIVFAICLVVIYSSLTVKEFFHWCGTIGVKPFSGWGETGEKMDIQAINTYGEELSGTIENMEEVAESYYAEHPEETSILDFFNSIGFVVVSDLQRNINHIVTTNIRISIFLSISIAVGFAIITKKNISNVLKFVVGYILVLIVIPPIYMYSMTNRFWSLREMYFDGTPKAFYIAYTIIFVVMLFINYIIGRCLSNKLNKTIKNNPY